MFGATLTLSSFWEFSPHLLDPLQHHVAVSVKSLHSAQQLLVVPELIGHFMQNLFSLINALPAVDQDLGVVLDGVGEDPEGPGGELLLLLCLTLFGGHVCLAGHPDHRKYLSETKYMKFSHVYIDGCVCTAMLRDNFKVNLLQL